MEYFWISHSTMSLPARQTRGEPRPRRAPAPAPARSGLTVRRVRDDGDEQALAPHPHALVGVLHGHDHPLHLRGGG